MTPALRRQIAADLMERLPKGWKVQASSPSVVVRGPLGLQGGQLWQIGTSAPGSYPHGYPLIQRWERTHAGGGMMRTYADFTGRRGQRKLLVDEMLRLITANPPIGSGR